MRAFVAHRSETQVDAGDIGAFATRWEGSDCAATTGDGTSWRFSVERWEHGQAHAYEPDEAGTVGTYQRQRALGYAGEVTFRDVTYELSTEGLLTKSYHLRRDGAEVMSLRFKQSYVMGDDVEGGLDEALDPGLALFFVWLVYLFRNENLWMASAPPALS